MQLDLKLAAEHARLIAGTYEASRRAQSSFLSVLYLVLQTKVMVNDDGTISVSDLQGLNGQPKKWRERAPFVWGEVGGKERLAAKVENGKVVMFSVDELSPYMMFQPVPWWKSSAWLLPLLLGGLAAVLLTAAGWPTAAIVRRRYGVPFSLTGIEARAYRLIRVACISTIAILGAWAATIAPIATNVFLFSTRLDPWIRTLGILSLVVFVGAAAIALWNAWVVCTGKRSRVAKLWNVVLALGYVPILWVAVAFNLIGFSVNY